ncbi:hypothetical protein JRQ81_002096 [Phrynocephalus forsythii]|uniref:Uncharacterized protein n=1 Tax=Phrynocephalus forsythii TaxID=171643 RepID=A0A9Q0XH92_9SAUR|nr:hypothetical protein JRQ81_002096 [Phrynocephalus forsythii]
MKGQHEKLWVGWDSSDVEEQKALHQLELSHSGQYFRTASSPRAVVAKKPCLLTTGKLLVNQWPSGVLLGNAPPRNPALSPEKAKGTLTGHPHSKRWPLAPSRHSATQDLRAQTTKHDRSTKEACEKFKNKSLLVQLQKTYQTGLAFFSSFPPTLFINKSLITLYKNQPRCHKDLERNFEKFLFFR